MSATAVRLRLLCRGVVQGVGFRPWVQRLATELGLTGELCNGWEGVSVDLAGPRPQLECFLRRLAAELPSPARLEPLLPQWGPALLPGVAGVRIGASPPQALGVGLVAPTLAADRAPCAACLAELADPGSRRFGDPFISCARCGPRYSIAVARPYLRAHTTLAGFPLCAACQREFDDPSDRRFHAETLSCPRCGPRLSFWPGADQPCGELEGGADPRPHPARPADPLGLASELLAAGRILALQGVGGFQLLVAADDPLAVARLRQRKQRPAKPFALLVADEAWLEAGLWIDDAERAALRDGAAPIVLLRRRPSRTELWPGVAPGSPLLGVMRPASPRHHLLLRRCGRPRGATSGNRSGEPLCIEPLEARQRLAGIADAFLVHNRPIARPLDDSVLQVIGGLPVLLRRARGYAPEALPLPAADPALPAFDQALLALSGDLKCAPGLAVGDRFWLAPHLGDLAAERCQQRLVQGLAELAGAPPGPRPPVPQQRAAAPPPGPPLPAVSLASSPPLPPPLPITLVCDAHPGYLSHQLACASGLPLRTVQHHLAHGLAVMAEHGLEPPLLVAGFDGLGYGEPLTAAANATTTAVTAASASSGSGQADGEPAADAHRLWGGELLLISRSHAGDLGGAVGAAADSGGGWDRSAGAPTVWQAQHLAGLRPFPLPGGERALREPRRAALGLLLAAQALDHPGAWRVRAAFAPADLALLCQAVAAGCQAPLCSSAGRLVDGVAALLGLVQVLSYEGEGGLRLQGAAARAAPGSWPLPGAFPAVEGHADPLPLLAPAGGAGRWQLDWVPLLFRVLEAVAAGAPREVVAARFHWDLAEGLASALAAWADRLGLGADQRRVALAGGCFQNRLLLEATSAGLRRRGLQPWWSQQVPGNDGGLALGQVWAVRRGLARELL